jgi:RNA polymerase sigma-70 factor (ECF subfamily)
VPVREHPALRAEFEALYDEQFAFVWRSLRSFGVSQASLEDATQDVFVVVYRRFGAWEQLPSLRAWLHGVARRVAASRRRTDQRHHRKLEALPRAENVHAIDERVDARQQLTRIAAAIDALAPERREVYVLAEIEGMRPPEIAAVLGCKLNTVYSRLRRAREQLSAALTQLEHARAQTAAVQAAAANDRGSHARHGRTR